MREAIREEMNKKRQTKPSPEEILNRLIKLINDIEIKKCESQDIDQKIENTIILLLKKKKYQYLLDLACLHERDVDHDEILDFAKRFICDIVFSNKNIEEDVSFFGDMKLTIDLNEICRFRTSFATFQKTQKLENNNASFETPKVAPLKENIKKEERKNNRKQTSKERIQQALAQKKDMIISLGKIDEVLGIKRFNLKEIGQFTEIKDFLQELQEKSFKLEVGNSFVKVTFNKSKKRDKKINVENKPCPHKVA